jgi:hypothetical protein
MGKYFDAGSLFVIGITFILFFVALLVKGMTHDILLEAGVFLVSVKLIMAGYKSNRNHEHILEELKNLSKTLDELRRV